MERKRLGESASSSAARPPVPFLGALPQASPLREETSAVSDMAKKPLRRIRKTMTAIWNAALDISRYLLPAARRAPTRLIHPTA